MSPASSRRELRQGVHGVLGRAAAAPADPARATAQLSGFSADSRDAAPGRAKCVRDFVDTPPKPKSRPNHTR